MKLQDIVRIAGAQVARGCPQAGAGNQHTLELTIHWKGDYSIDCRDCGWHIHMPMPTEMPWPKIVCMCGSTRFIDIMAVAGWLIERDEGAIVLGLHLIPRWYPDCPDDHLAEHEGVKERLDELHLRKIDLADEVFIVNFNSYLGESTQNEVNYARQIGKPLRWFTHDPIGEKVSALMPGTDVHRANRQFERMFPGAPKENI